MRPWWRDAEVWVSGALIGTLCAPLGVALGIGVLVSARAVLGCPTWLWIPWAAGGWTGVLVGLCVWLAIQNKMDDR